MAYPKVVIIILNWNGWIDTIECLESLYRITYPNYEIIVVDNGSENESVEKIKNYALGNIKSSSYYFEYCLDNKPIKYIEYAREELEISKNAQSGNQLIIIKNEKNYGFAEGNNIGIRYALNNLNPEYIMLLNNDTVVDDSFINKLLEVSKKDDRIAILGPVSYQYNSNVKIRKILSYGGKIDWNRYPGYYDIYHKIDENLVDLNGNEIMECDWVSGAAMMIKINDKIPIYLDNTFFFGCEDADLCIRLKCEGYKIVSVFESKIWHKFGNSRNKRYDDRLKRFLANFRTNLKFIKKHNKNYFIRMPLYFIQISLELLNEYILKKIY